MDETVIPDSQHDTELARIRSQIQALRTRRSLLQTTLLSSPHTLTRLNRAKATQHAPPPALTDALKTVQSHHRLLQQTSHRLAAGATAFLVQDPDPAAAGIDSGRVLGVRIEASVRGRFADPYFLLLHRPWQGSAALRVHKHTIPPCVPLPALLARWLPAPLEKDKEGAGKRQRGRRQDLGRLVREIRREVLSLHLRLAAVETLRREVGLAPSEPAAAAVMEATEEEDDAIDEEQGVEQPPRRSDAHVPAKGGIEDIKALDPSVREVEITWADGRIARMKIARDGRIEGAVVREHGEGMRGRRNRDVEKMILGGDGRVEGVVRRLLANEGGGGS
ncbi:hypothetical protein W97_05651 [Coniosporium apollinis CBS 100218]|uniref:Cenp-O kinetochore centromere component n=1 Tax=Coniosporium apollinis (strain CBS 100218) TaxID=1168221 RepID=R7YWP0_CONA1|nr:uncharacterized protein W97_05651 [Coniosporium apollinis CBS 100218]EON66258.1 hypothetical protein W97_05651 [Coniosporium apollinis CBS 100218]